MNLMANLKDSVKQDKLIDMAMAAAVPVWVRYIPSMLALNGWAGYLTAYVVPILIGMFFKKPALTLSAIGMGVGHLVYHYTNDPSKPDGIWDLDPNGTGSIQFLPKSTMSGYHTDDVNGEPIYSLSGYHNDLDTITTLSDNFMADSYPDNEMI